MIGLTETIARFGTGQRLCGILAVPAEPVAEGTPAVVIPNTGIGHRASHHRLFVIVARELAAAGYPVLRFDLSGLGDSANRDRFVDRTESDSADLRAAVDFVEAAGHNQVVLCGLCSGADRSVVFAGRDPRVRGLILIDPTILPTLRYLTNMARGVLGAGLVKGFLKPLAGAVRRSIRRRRDKQAVAARRGTGPAAWRAWYKLPAFLEANYAAVVANKAQLLVIFTSGVQRRHSYERWLNEAFPRIDFADRLVVRCLDGVHHLFMLEQERKLATDSMRAWLASRWPGTGLARVTPAGEAPSA